MVYFINIMKGLSVEKYYNAEKFISFLHVGSSGPNKEYFKVALRQIDEITGHNNVSFTIVAKVGYSPKIFTQNSGLKPKLTFSINVDATEDNDKHSDFMKKGFMLMENIRKEFVHYMKKNPQYFKEEVARKSITNILKSSNYVWKLYNVKEERQTNMSFPLTLNDDDEVIYTSFLTKKGKPLFTRKPTRIEIESGLHTLKERIEFNPTEEDLQRKFVRGTLVLLTVTYNKLFGVNKVFSVKPRIGAITLLRKGTGSRVNPISSLPKGFMDEFDDDEESSDDESNMIDDYTTLLNKQRQYSNEDSEESRGNGNSDSDSD